MKRYLLVEPDFPIPKKSKNHKNFLPIGLLKLASYLMYKGHEIKLYRGTLKKDDLEDIKNFNPQEIWITSLFTYWSDYVINTVHYYKDFFPKAKITVGGIYASLIPVDEVKKQTGCHKVYQGVHPEAEKHFPAYDLIGNNLDYQIIHSSRGCSRRCAFCGTWKIEPEFISENSIKDKIKYPKIIFYDNNFLKNPYVENILDELIELKKEKKIKWCESQSGFDGRILLENPHLGGKIKQAGFKNVRIAWDGKLKDYHSIKKQIDIFINAGYKAHNLYIFMLYNYNIPFEEMEKKRKKCYNWCVQISDCRYRPLNQLFDHYDARRPDQSNENYYIHTKGGWSDDKIRLFRKHIRMQNICIRQHHPFYSKEFEADGEIQDEMN